MDTKFKKLINSKTYKFVDLAVFVLFLVGAAYAMLFLFYRQAVSDGNTFMSDMGPYIKEMLGEKTQFDFPYPVLFKTGAMINLFASSPEWAMAITIMIFNVLAMVITRVVITKETGAKLLATFCTLGLFFLSMIYSDAFKAFGIPYRYEGVMSPNPWHNGTYMAARPFMILAFVLGTMTLDRYEEKLADLRQLPINQKKLYFWFAMSMLLVTITKPSYTIVHMAAAGVIMICCFLAGKCKTFKQNILLGCCYIPTIIALLYQYVGVFQGTGADYVERGIGFEFGRVWGQYTTNYPLALVLAAAFPFATLLFHFKDLKDNIQYRFGWQIYLAATLMALCLYEKGFREWHFNFGWGYICGLFIVFMCAVIVLLKDTMELLNGKLAKGKLIAIIIQWMLFGTHVLMGLRYFQILCWGGNYI